MDNKKVDDVLHWIPTIGSGVYSAVWAFPSLQDGRKIAISKDLIENKEAEISAIVNGVKPLPHTNLQQITDLKLAIQNLNPDSIELTFGQNLSMMGAAGTLGLIAGVAVYAGIEGIREKFGTNIDRFCDGAYNMIQNVFNPNRNELNS